MKLLRIIAVFTVGCLMAPLSTSASPFYTTCVACHGAKGEGNKALNAPAIGSQEAWYVERQLKNFKSGVRGTHEKDLYGKQMRPMAMTLPNDEAIKQVSAYVASLPAPPKEDLKGFGGDPAKGKGLYVTCIACHGAKGEGKKMLNAPKIASLPSWYLVRQLQYFKSGVRGTNPKDMYGAQMRPMSMTLPNDQAIKDVVAYIKSF